MFQQLSVLRLLAWQSRKRNRSKTYLSKLFDVCQTAVPLRIVYFTTAASSFDASANVSFGSAFTRLDDFLLDAIATPAEIVTYRDI